MAPTREIIQSRIDDANNGGFASMDDQQFVESKLATKFILSWMAELTAYHREFGNTFGRTK